MCRGTCTTLRDGAPVDCVGRCDGTCAPGGRTGGSGPQPDGSCNGTCQGSCETTAAPVECGGACIGECTTSCAGSPEAPVKCDGECRGASEPLYCNGSKIDGGCHVSERCNLACDAIVAARAVCAPPVVHVEIFGANDINAAAKLEATLEANLGHALVLVSRFYGMQKFASPLYQAAISPGTGIRAACMSQVAFAMQNAHGDVVRGAEGAWLIATAW